MVFTVHKSWALVRQKLAAIPLVFWASALHGIYGYCQGEDQLEKLRNRALSPLRTQKAGVNPLLRLMASEASTPCSPKTCNQGAPFPDALESFHVP